MNFFILFSDRKDRRRNRDRVSDASLDSSRSRVNQNHNYTSSNHHTITSKNDRNDAQNLLAPRPRRRAYITNHQASTSSSSEVSNIIFQRCRGYAVLRRCLSRFLDA